MNERNCPTEHSSFIRCDSISTRYRTLAPTIRRIVARELSRQHRLGLDNSDLEQMVWKSIVRNRVLLKDYTNSHLLAWATIVAKNRLIDHCRKKSPTESPDGHVDQLLSRSDNQTKLAMANDIREFLTSGLPPEFMRLVQMREDGHELDTISTRLGIPRRTLQRMLQRLRQRVCALADVNKDS